MKKLENLFLQQTGIEVPIIGGAMFPCSNIDLVAAVSEAGGIGIIQPTTLSFVFKTDLRTGIALIREKTTKPIGLNVIAEQSSQKYLARMQEWVDIALEHGIKFFVTSLGNPKWIVQRAEAQGAVVYHTVTERKWALKALDAGVKGLIAVNARAGGHAGNKSSQTLFVELQDLGVPLVCAGGVGSPADYAEAMQQGYLGVQMGTRFIASQECNVHKDYKDAIIRAGENDIVLTERISGVPVAVIRTAYVDRVGTKAGWIARRLLQHPKYKRYIRTIYTVQAAWKLRAASRQGHSYEEYFQAGKSVSGINQILSVAEIIELFRTTKIG